MNAQTQEVSPDAAILQALTRLKEAESDLRAAIRPQTRLNGALLEAYAFVQEAIDALSVPAAASAAAQSQRVDVTSVASSRGARLL